MRLASELLKREFESEENDDDERHVVGEYK
jgi:hypothetical protein